MRNTLRSYSEKYLQILLLLCQVPSFFNQEPQNDSDQESENDSDQESENDSDQESENGSDQEDQMEILRLNHPFRLVAHRRMIITNNNDIIQVLSSHARSIRQTMLILSGKGFISDALVYPTPRIHPFGYRFFDRHEIGDMIGIFQSWSPNRLVQEHVTENITVSTLLVSLMDLDGGFHTASRLITDGDVKLDVLFFRPWSIFQEDEVDESATPTDTSNGITYIDD